MAGTIPAVDAHVHFWTDDEARYPFASGFTAADPWLPTFTPGDYQGC
jgi:predicted TIM-barrel fold metal-dependent hydrolase